MSSVASTVKADVVEQQMLVSTTAPVPRAATTAPPPLSKDEASISSTGRLRGTTMVVRDAIQGMAQIAMWHAQKVQSSAPDQVQASADAAPTGSHDVRVDALADTQVTASATFSSLSTVIGIGTLNIEVGKWSGGSSTFATNPNWPKANVTMSPKDNTLERVRDRINAAGVGVTATVVSDATGSRLLLSASNSGENNGFRIQAEPVSAEQAMAHVNELSKFSFSPDQDGSGPGMQLMKSAQDAQVTVDGRTLRSASNVVDDPVTGLQLSLQGTTAETARLDVKPDDDVVKHRLQSLVAGIHDLQGQAQQVATAGEGNVDQARQEARGVLDTVRASLTGPDAASWQAIGLSWDAQQGVRQHDVTWTPELRQTGQRLFATLATAMPATNDTAPLPASASAPSASLKTSEAAVQRNRQLLLDQYTVPSAASAEPLRQALAVS